MATATSPRNEYRHGVLPPALLVESQVSSLADSGGMCSIERRARDSNPRGREAQLFSGQFPRPNRTLSMAEGERIERPRAFARLPVSNGTPDLSGNLPRRAAGRRG